MNSCPQFFRTMHPATHNFPKIAKTPIAWPKPTTYSKLIIDWVVGKLEKMVVADNRLRC